ncbi:MAG: AAA family ATPase [Clostridia bacterium]|nr:AAA family ATPase [Clostridia bacterium]
MIIMINGPFGVGKTTVAELLHQKLKNSMIYDPEEVGFMLRNIITDEVKLPKEKTDDFQDLILWKELTVTVAEKLVNTYHKTLIVPMTICNHECFSHIKSGFESIDETYHFCLLASEETVHERLSKRGDEAGSWAFQQTERCLNAYNADLSEFEKVIYTDELTENEVCEAILSALTSH